MSCFWQDLRYGARTLARDLTFTVVAVLVLALGVGAATAIFSVVNAVLLRPLPYAAPDRLVAVTGLQQIGPERRTSRTIPLADIPALRENARTITSIGAFAFTQLPVRVGDRSWSPVTALMDAEFLPTLGSAPAQGTLFDASATDGSDRTAIISHALWVEAFGADPAAIGRGIVVDGEPYTVRAVLAEHFQFPRSDASYFRTPVDLLIPASTFPNFPADMRQWFGIARLAPGVTQQQAEAELQSIASTRARATSAGDRGWTVRLTALHEETTGAARESLLVLLGISLVLVLIAASNLMNLFFSRGVTRTRELSIRKALGSTTGRLVRQLAAESLVLAGAGCSLGVLLAWYAIDVVVSLSPLHLPGSGDIGLDLSVLAFSVAVAVAATVGAALVPAIHLTVSASPGRLSGVRTTAPRAVARLQRGLCVAQIALGLALLASAGLLAHSLWRLNTVDPGFARAQVIGFGLSVPTDRSMEDRQRFYARALDEIRAIPGVENAGLISFLPPETRAGVFMPLVIDGVPPVVPDAPPPVINTLVSSPEYFATMRVPILRGRAFLAADGTDARPVAIVNEALARRYFADRDPIGRLIGTGFDGGTPVREIVGIVSDTHDRGLARDAYPTAYLPFAQFALPYGAIALRTDAPAAVVPQIRARLARLDPAVPLTDVESIDDRIRQSLREPRFYTVLALACASMAVLFVALGLYGLVSYSVSRRSSEFGIRMAVGATQATIARLVLGEGLRMAATGLGLGLVLAALLTRSMRSLLFGVDPLDPLTLGTAAGVVLLVTLAASYSPARRAARVDPMTALRQE